MPFPVNEKSVPRVHLIGSLAVVLLLTLVLATFFTWQNLVERRESFARIERGVNEQVRAEVTSEFNSALSYIEFARSRSEMALRLSLKQQVDLAHQIAQSIYDRESPRRSLAEVKQLIVEALRQARFYEGRGYYFIDDMSGKFILLPTAPQFEGQTKPDNQDDTGHFIMRGLIEAARKPEGEGYTRYRWYMPDDPEKMADKLAYVRHFAPFDWLIGTGDYTYKWEQLQQQEAIARLRSVRFGRTGYIALIDRDGSALISPSDPSIVGLKTEAMPAIQREASQRLINKAKAGGGFVNYQWLNPETGNLATKTALVQTVEPWGWIVVVTIFNDELQHALAIEKAIFEKDSSTRLFRLLLVVGVAFALAIAASWLFSRWSRQLFASYHERNLAQQSALLASEQKLAIILDSVEAHIYIKGRDYRYLYANRQLLALFGKTLDEVIGKDDDTLYFSPEAAAAIRRNDCRVLERGERVAEEEVNTDLDGRVIKAFVSIKLPLRDSEGKVYALCGISTDITERKQNEAELQKYRDHLESLVHLRTLELAEAKDEAEAASRAKSRFLANMSHEIRTPMNAVLGLAHLLLRDASEPKAREQLGKLLDSGKHLLNIINNILDFSKIEAGKLVLEQVAFSPAQIVDRCFSMLHERASAKGLCLLKQIDPALPDWVLGDALRLEQSVLNYVGNAIKFSERGTITLRASVCDDDGQTVLLRFEVEDQGIGIAREQRDKLFSAFTQADDSTTRRFGGSGLGLVISRQLAQLMGGEVGVESELGRGSTFWISLRLPKVSKPAALAAPGEAGAKLPENRLQQRFGGTRVLLVEDDAISREVALALLDMAGLQVDSAENGQEALDLVRANDYALVLMDMQMPVLGGLEATRAIRRLPGKHDLPIVAMTANAFEEDRDACLAAGMNDHIGKPVDPDVLFSTLLKWLEKGG